MTFQIPLVSHTCLLVHSNLLCFRNVEWARLVFPEVVQRGEDVNAVLMECLPDAVWYLAPFGEGGVSLEILELNALY